MTTAALEIHSVDAGYAGRIVLQKVSLRLDRGQSAALIGPNGCGKSTLLRIVAGILRPLTGEVFVNGEPMNARSVDARVRAGLGYLLQTRNVFSGLTVEENLALAGGGRADAEMKRRVLDAFGSLANKRLRRAGLLSGGERQALGIAMVLLRKPTLLLLDEPAAGLSPKAVGELFGALHALQRDERFTMLTVEHRLRQTQPIVDRVFVMREGRIVDDVDDTTRMLDPVWLANHYATPAP